MTKCPSQGDTSQVFTLLPYTVSELVHSKGAVFWGTSLKANSGLEDLEPTFVHLTDYTASSWEVHLLAPG